MPTRIAVVGDDLRRQDDGREAAGRAAWNPAYVQLDALHWGPGWSEPTAEEFRARVEEALSAESWVADGAYHGKLGDLVVEKVDLVVWLDPPLATVLRRLGTRTVRRVRAAKSSGAATARPGAGRSSAATPCSSGR